MDALKSLGGFAHWLPRLSLAATFGFHAWPKLTASAAVGEVMGMPGIVVMMLGLAEFAGVALILYGGVGPDWATQVAGLIFAVVMVGAIAMVHGAIGFNSIGEMGMEFQLLILATALYFATKGNDAN